MGEEEKKEEEKKEGGGEEKKEEEIVEEIVLKVDMHCEACARKVARSLRGFKGVEGVTTNCKASKVVVKGKEADPIKVSERIQKKTGRKVMIISPLPKPLEPEPGKPQEPEPPKEEKKKEEPPPVVTVVLKMSMHCEACARRLQRRIRKISGVESVKTDIGNDEVLVTGVVEPEKLVNDVYKKTGKQASIVVKEKEEEKKKEEEDKKDEEKKETVEKEEKKEEEEEETTNLDIKKSQNWGSNYYMEYAYAPQIFSDENPNACSIM